MGYPFLLKEVNIIEPIKLRTESSYCKRIKDIKGSDRYLYEDMPTLPDGIMIIDLNNPSNVKSGHIPVSTSAMRTLVRKTKLLCSDDELVNDALQNSNYQV